MIKHGWLLIPATFFFIAPPVNAAIFSGLGIPEDSSFSRAIDVSPDGKVVVGSVAEAGAFYWKNGLMTVLGPDTLWASGASYDGSIIVGIGRAETMFELEAFVWSADEAFYLGNLSDVGNHSGAYDVSYSGSVVIGTGESEMEGGSGYIITVQEAFRWTEEDGMIGLGNLQGGLFSSHALGVSADGSIVVGYSGFESGIEACRWTVDGGMVGLGDLMGGNFYSKAFDVSADGSVVTGYSESTSGYEAFRWENDVMFGLDDLPGGTFYSEAWGVSADGSVIVGFSDCGGDILGATNTYDYDKCNLIELGVEAFIWDAEHGMRNLKGLLEGEYGLDLNGWTLLHAYSISADGMTIVGDGVNPDGYYEGWIATIPEPSTVILLCLGIPVLVVIRRV